MNGSSQLQAIVYTVDDAEVPAVAAAFSTRQVTVDYGYGSPPVRLGLGTVYGTGEVPAGSARALAAALIATAPSAAFIIWQDPSRPANGSYIGRLPGVGNLEAECNVHGTPLISLRKVVQFFSTSRREAWTRTEDNEAGQVQHAAEVLDALAVLARRLLGAPGAV
ncbi:hypothetical protein [Streptomyces mutabilis]|uniref:hypothetical protein n=1 Tax=Streptomyces mutabilis TaxID=67332 RepID=UPI000694B204|nr:hypothetical protein [Streptomyces mutabilis]